MPDEPFPTSKDVDQSRPNIREKPINVTNINN